MNLDITYSLMIPLLEAIHTAVHSYGWAIILTTLLIRLLVWPLVASSTKSMQRMSQLQPKLKALQEKYKDRPEEFQKKAMEFYQKNKINPLGGCLPTLVQLPILIALYATFMGPPFQDKPIPVKVNIAPQAKSNDVKVVSNPTSGASSPYLSETGKRAKFVVQPGDQTVVAGNEPITKDFHVIAVEGDAPANFEPQWKIESDTNGATITPDTGAANFPKGGDIVVEARFPGANVQPIDVAVKVQQEESSGGGGGGFLNIGGKDPFIQKSEQSSDTRTITFNGQQIEVAVTPGPSTVHSGSKNVPFALKAIKGNVEGLPVVWHIVKDPNAATIDANGHAVFPLPGDVVVAAIIPGVAKDEPFLFISSLGKIAKGMDMLKPQNFDVLGMLVAFLITMYMSQKLMMPSSSTTTDPEQAAIQKQTQQTMPIAITAMFFFFALPAGCFLYLVVSNVVQTLQSWLIYQQPNATLVDVDGGDDSGDNGGKIIDISGDGGNGSGAPGGKISDSKKQKKKQT